MAAVVIRGFHFCYGLLLFVTGGYACLNAANADAVSSWLCGVPVLTFAPAELLMIQSVALEICSSGIYSIVSACFASHFGRRFFSLLAFGQVLVGSSLVVMAMLSPTGIVTPFLYRLATLYFGAALVTVLLLPDRKEPLPERFLLLSYSQASHALYDFSLFCVMNAMPGIVSPSMSTDTPLIVRALGIHLLMGVVLYGSSMLPDRGLWGFRLLSVFTRVNAVVILGVLAWLGNVDPVAFYVGSCDALFAAVIVIDLRREAAAKIASDAKKR